MGRGQGQERLQAGGSCWTTSGEEELEEGEWGPDYSGEDGWGPVHASRAWATDEPDGDGWGAVVADESGWGNAITRKDRSSYDKLGNNGWNDHYGDHSWGTDYTQSS